MVMLLLAIWFYGITATTIQNEFSSTFTSIELASISPSASSMKTNTLNEPSRTPPTQRSYSSYEASSQPSNVDSFLTLQTTNFDASSILQQSTTSEKTALTTESVVTSTLQLSSQPFHRSFDIFSSSLEHTSTVATNYLVTPNNLATSQSDSPTSAKAMTTDSKSSSPKNIQPSTSTREIVSLTTSIISLPPSRKPSTTQQPTTTTTQPPLPAFKQNIDDTSIFVLLPLSYPVDSWEEITVYVVIPSLGYKSTGSWYRIFIKKEKHDRYPALVMKPKQLSNDPRRKRRSAAKFLNIKLGISKDCTKVDQEICNGPLTPSTNYSIQLEVFFTNGTSLTTPSSKPWSTLQKAVIVPQEGVRSSVVIIILTVLLVFFIFLTIIITIIVCRKKRSRKYLRGQQDKDSMGVSLMSTNYQRNGASRLKKKFSGPDILTERRKSLKGMTRPVFIRDFRAWVERSASDSTFRFAEEFESIRDVGKFERHEVADMAENNGKNRYVNVLPYDYTRVKLSSIDDEPGSDYINANYIHGYKQPRAYIATQGPLPSTTDHFWQMVWEQKSRIIVMVTQCNEKNRVKCHQYWPASGSTRYGEIEVTLKHETIYPEWTEREFLMTFEGESRLLRHFQYTAWPDHGVPRSSKEMLQFVTTVRFHQRPDDGPVICHCSAGVGRTGTYLCVDILVNKLQTENNVDVYGVVCLMRTQRCSMVQTEDQYIFIHRVILDYLKQRDEKQQIFSGYSTLEMRRKSKSESNPVEPAAEALLKEEEKEDEEDENLDNDDDETKSDDFLSEEFENSDLETPPV
eukprot:TCONS_00001087-protein